MDFGRLGPLLDLLPYRHAPLLEAALGPRRGFLLDLGGGTGRVARRLHRDRIVVCDVERDLLQRAMKRRLRAVQCDARFLPFKEGSAAAAFAVDAFHHMQEQDRVLGEAKRVLAPGSRLVLEEFDPHRFKGAVIEYFEGLAGFGSEFRSPKSLLTAAEKAGFAARIERWSRGDYALVAERPS